MMTFASIAVLLIVSFTTVLQGQEYRWAKNIGTDWTSFEGIQTMSMAVSSNGNTVIVGSFRGTADFDPGAGTATLTSAGMGDMFFAKYDASGNYLWAKNVGGIDDLCVAFSVVTDANDNIYVSGYFGDTVDFDPGNGIHLLMCPSTFQNQDGFIAKFTSSGEFVWAKNIAGPDVTRVYNIDLDREGNIYAVGYFNETTDFDPGANIAELTCAIPFRSNLFFAKYDNNGNYKWAKQIASTTEYVDVALGANNTVFVTGTFTDTVDFDPGNGTAKLAGNANLNMFFAKYDADGEYQFAHHVQNAYSVSFYGRPGRGIAVDNKGDLYLTGTFSSFNGTDFDPGDGTAILTTVGSSNFFLAKYNASGDYQWAKSLNGDSESRGIYIDRSQTLITTGIYHAVVDFDFGNATTTLPLYPNQTFISRYHLNGSYISVGGFGNGASDYVTGMGVDGNNNLYCTGLFSNDNTDFDLGPGTINLSKTLGAWQDVFISKYQLEPVSSVSNQMSNDTRISVFPNPTSGVLTILHDGTLQITQVEVYNALGERLLQLKNASEVDLSDVVRGAYTVRICVGENCSSHIVIVE